MTLATAPCPGLAIRIDPAGFLAEKREKFSFLHSGIY
jgi:hypothetical protein